MPAIPTTDVTPVTGAHDDVEWEPDLDYLEVRAALMPFDSDDAIAVEDMVGLRDEDLLTGGGPASVWDLVLLDSIDPAGLDRDGQLTYLRHVEGLKALVAAFETRATVALAGGDGSDSRRDRHVAMEVGQLRRVGEGAAASGIATARSLSTEYPKFLAALAEGTVSEWHCRVLVSETVHVTDPDTVAALQDRLLPKAKRMTPTQFRRAVRTAVVELDAERAAERFERARSTRYVTCKPLEDGLGYLGVVSDWPTIKAMHEVITADGRDRQLALGGAQAVRDGDLDATADACRADALAARVLGRVDEDGCLSWDREPATVSLTLVMDLDTLRGEADRHALLDGEPVPAGIAREFADAATSWRRAVTDPVTGHLLDYGREQYLPAKLRDYVLARDRCRVPGCTTRATSRLEMDHAVPFPEGTTSAANAGGLCRAHHQLKTARLADLTDSNADGSGTWTTAWGQRTPITPRPFLHDPTDQTHPTSRRPDVGDPPPTAASSAAPPETSLSTAPPPPPTAESVVLEAHLEHRTRHARERESSGPPPF